MDAVSLPLRAEVTHQTCKALLAITDVIVAHHDLASLFQALGQRLHAVVAFDMLALSIYEPEHERMRLHLFDAPMDLPPPPKYYAAEGSLAGLVWRTQQPVLVADIPQEAHLPVQIVREYGFGSCCVLPLTSARQRLGALTFASLRTHGYDDTDIAFLSQVAKQVALAVDNALNAEQLARERDRSRMLLEVNNAVVSTLNLRELVAETAKALRRVASYEYVSLSLYDPDTELLHVQALDFVGGQGLIQEGITVRVEDSPAGLAIRARRPVAVTLQEAKEKFASDYVRRLTAEGAKSGCGFPLISHGRLLGVLAVVSLTKDVFPPEDIALLEPIADQVALAVENALSFQHIVELANKLTEEKLYLEDEIRTKFDFAHITGESQALKRVLKQVETVAPTDSTVLIIGETGTGKELIARAIHDLSTRRERTLVKLNCAAIPTGLLESELFGHEKGAFTGAIAPRVGRFELAHRGTLFLDEIGDIALELQPKLLRVLQEQEFERLGSTRTQKVDVRLIAATNADLEHLVAERKYRSDLFYRLNVFPIMLPPLRERGEDIVLLVSHFVQKFSQRFKKKIHSLNQRSLDRLREYHWPGNIRELENFIERAVLLAEDETLSFDSPFNQNGANGAKQNASTAAPGLRTLEEVERDYILEVLRQTKGVVGGKGGAAEILGLPPSTLRSRMKKLGIK